MTGLRYNDDYNLVLQTNQYNYDKTELIQKTNGETHLDVSIKRD